MTSKLKTALDASEESVTGLSRDLMQQVLAGSRSSPRKRMILPLHKNDSALLQRMLNAVQPGTYIRPHRRASDRAESIVVLQGAIRFFVFSEAGEIIQTLDIRGGSPMFGIDFEGGVWHSFLALESDTVLFEVKPGPYHAETDKEFAPWAPEEFSERVEPYLQKLTTSS